MKADNVLVWIAFVPLIISITTSAHACSIDDIRIKNAEIVRHGSEGQFSTIVGELVNGCDDAIGVQLHITLRDSAAKVVSTSDPWPAGVHNIRPHSTYAFTVNAEEPRPAVRAEIDVTEVRKW